jgi:hypothetical protein
MKVSVVVVGDSKIGKTALIQQFTHKRFTQVRTKTSLKLDIFMDDFLQHLCSFFLHKDGMLIYIVPKAMIKTMPN